ncbi:MAG: hypothetical protein ABMB14_40285 [Myxococcota bacterium]
MMTQLQFSVDAEIAARLEARAKQRGTTLSRYLAQLVCRELGDAWPEGYLDRVIGSCASDPLEEPGDSPLRR